MTQQEGLQVLTGPPQIFHRGFPGTYQFSHRLVLWIWYPDRSQLSCTMQLGQGQRITAVGLDPFSGRFGISDGATTMQSWPSRVI